MFFDMAFVDGEAASLEALRETACITSDPVARDRFNDAVRRTVHQEMQELAAFHPHPTGAMLQTQAEQSGQTCANLRGMIEALKYVTQEMAHKVAKLEMAESVIRAHMVAKDIASPGSTFVAEFDAARATFATKFTLATTQPEAASSQILPAVRGIVAEVSAPANRVIACLFFGISAFASCVSVVTRG